MLGIWGVVHVYVFTRLGSVPWIAQHASRRTLIILAVILWLSYPLTRFISNRSLLAWPFEFLAANWVGFFFLLFALFFMVDVLTLGGVLFAKWTPLIRTLTALAAVLLGMIALIQGYRAPVVSEYEVHLPGLPQERDKLSVVALTDLHLGRLTGRDWLEKRVAQVDALHPDLVVISGDLADSDARQVEPLIPVLKQLRAPLGVWAVTGNHDLYAGIDHTVSIMEKSGFHVLRDRWEQVLPGLILAGVDDLGSRRDAGDAIPRALTNRPAGGTLYLSHTPSHAENAAALRAGLMISGHTHNGQIWPFNYLVRLRYSLLSGRYDINGMTVLVCRGTGTWGPRMRLWQRGEILKITLRSADAKAAHKTSAT